MSTPEPSGDVAAGRPAERVLFQGLFDDAAVFPPGLAPLPQAVRDHVARQSGPYADLVGPLLLPVSAVAELLNLEHPSLEIALVGRPGTSLALVGEALSALGERPGVTLAGVEVGWTADWHQSTAWGALTAGSRGSQVLRSIEVPRDLGLEDALSDIHAQADDASGVDHPVQAKFRTGSAPSQPAPTAFELATFIRASVDHDLSFKLTGGLHHAISQTTPAGEDQLGFLNVIAATRWALAHGAEVPEMESLLSQRELGPIVDIITRMSEADASVLRAFFTSYGCCGVMDPIGDLATLGLIREKAL
jgi:hypothetical protein